MIDLDNFFDTSENSSRPTIQLIISFAAFLVPFFVFVVLLRKIPAPDILTNAPVILPVAAGTISLKLALERFFNKSLFHQYGMKRKYLKDLIAGVILGVIFQGLITILMIQNGSAELISVFSFSTGVPVHLWLTAFISTAFGFFAVAFWEELMFRGVLIKNASEALNSRLKHRQISTIIAILLGPIIFGIPHISAIAEGASPSFAVFQASVAALYFGIAYVLTDSIAMPIGIHFMSNFWFTSILGAPENGFPALARVERNLQIGLTTLIEYIMPAITLIGLIVLYSKITEK
jgi:membrane protease YdiL (CAAX protease family)